MKLTEHDDDENNLRTLAALFLVFVNVRPRPYKQLFDTDLVLRRKFAINRTGLA